MDSGQLVSSQSLVSCLNVSEFVTLVSLVDELVNYFVVENTVEHRCVAFSNILYTQYYMHSNIEYVLIA